MLIKPDYSKDSLMTKFGYETVTDRYLRGKEQSPQEGYVRSATAFATDLEHAKRMYGYIANQYYGLSSPTLSNGPVRTKFEIEFNKNFNKDCFESVEGPQPISCFTGYVPDSRYGITEHYSEILWYLSNGGGYQASWSDLRPMNAITSLGNKTGGMVSFYHVTDALTPATHQGSNRRGVYGGEVRCDHVEIEEFVKSRQDGGDPNRRSHNVFQTISITNKFMRQVIKGGNWHLKDHLGNVAKTIKARYLWELILDLAAETGGPFLHFIDQSNRHLPEAQKKLGLKVNNVNICTEITLANNKDRTAVCCLGSVNLLHFDEWSKDPQFIPDIIEYLDNILEYFIQNAVYSCTRDLERDPIARTIMEYVPSASPEQVQALVHALIERHIMGAKKAVYSASQERAVGLGAMGLGSYLLQREIPYDSREALTITDKMFKHIKTEAVKASKALAIQRGEAPDMIGTGMRNSHLLAVAPTATNSTINAQRVEGTDLSGGLTPALEPRYEMVYTQKTKSGRFKVTEPKLIEVLRRHGQDNSEVYSSIFDNLGSVQHLDFLSDHEKSFLRTAREYNQKSVVEVAATAQQHVCQAISLNLDFHQHVPRKYVNAVHMHMWKKGIKSRYYVRMPALTNANVFAKSYESKITINYDAEDLFSGCEGCE